MNYIAKFKRLRMIDEMFRKENKEYRVEDIKEALESELELSFSPKQIYEDLKELKDTYKRPIVSAKGKYSYEDGYVPTKQEYTAYEKNILQTARDILEWNPDAWLMSRQLEGQLNDLPSDVISFQENLNIEVRENLQKLYSAINYKEVLNICYIDYFDVTEKKNKKVSPHLLKQYNNRWFLFYMDNEESNPFPKHIAVDKINEINFLRDEYINLPDEFNFEDGIFSEIIGVSYHRDEELMDVELEFFDELIHYVKSKPLHDSQKVNGNVVSLKVKKNYELLSLLLSYGDKFKINKPQELRDEMKTKLENMLKNYQ